MGNGLFVKLFSFTNSSHLAAASSMASIHPPVGMRKHTPGGSCRRHADAAHLELFVKLEFCEAASPAGYLMYPPGLHLHTLRDAQAARSAWG